MKLALLALAAVTVSAATKPAIPIAFEKTRNGVTTRSGGMLLKLAPGGIFEWSSAAVRLNNARPESQAVAEQPLHARASYFTSARRESNVALFGRARYHEVYPGIDLVFHGREGALEFDFEVAPHADPGRIVINAPKAKLESNGDLLIAQSIRWHKPRVFQNGREIAGSFRLDRGAVRFAIGAYDHSQPLLIDPTLTYSSFFGTAGNEYSRAITTDAQGNVYVAGVATSQDLPVSRDAAQSAFGGQTGGIQSGDGFVAKFSAAGALIYLTYLGGSADDLPAAIAVDAQGNAYVAGMTTSRNFPVTDGAPQRNYGGNGTGQIFSAGDAFLAKINATGSQIVYATLLGGNSDDEASAVAVDAQGNAYVAGSSSSLNFPVTSGAFQTGNKGNVGQPILPRFGQPFLRRGDVFVAKVNPAGTSLVYSTFLGGLREDVARSIALDPQGNAIVGGYTLSDDFPLTAGAYQTRPRGSDAFNEFFHLGDGFVAKLNAAGTGLVFSTLIGANGDDMVAALAIDAQGSIYVTGPTSSTDFPVTTGAYQTRNSGPVNGNFEDFDDDQLWGDAFVAKLSADGARLVWATYYGGIRDEIPQALVLDSGGNVIIGGMTLSATLTLTADAVQSTFGGRVRPFPGQMIGDGFVAQFDPNGARLLYATFLGGAQEDGVGGMAIDGVGNLWLTGNTASLNYPVAGTPTQRNFGGSQASQFFKGDAFLTRISGFGAPATRGSIRALVNAASGAQGAISPGMIFVAYTSEIGPEQLAGSAFTPAGLLDTTRAETRFLFDGVAAPIVYVSATQSSGIVPYSVAGKTSVQVVGEYRGQRSAPITLNVAPTAPGLFSANQSGSGQGALLNENGSYNSAANPAARGSVIVLFGTGEGQTNPPGVDGLVAAPPYPAPALPVTVTVGGRPATILYAAAAPGLVTGLFQVNVRLAADTPTGNQPVVVTVGGVASQSNLTVAVQ